MVAGGLRWSVGLPHREPDYPGGRSEQPRVGMFRRKLTGIEIAVYARSSLNNTSVIALARFRSCQRLWDRRKRVFPRAYQNAAKRARQSSHRLSASKCPTSCSTAAAWPLTRAAIRGSASLTRRRRWSFRARGCPSRRACIAPPRRQYPQKVPLSACELLNRNHAGQRESIRLIGKSAADRLSALFVAGRIAC